MPSLTNATIDLVLSTFILLPGFLWSLIWMKYSKTKPQTDKFYFLIYSLISTLFTYLAVYLLSNNCSFFNFSERDLISVFTPEITFIKAKIIFKSCSISFLAAIISVIASHYKIAWKILRICKITMLDGNEDLWEQTLAGHVKKQSSCYLSLHDLKQELIYQGYLVGFSESNKKRELILRNGSIFSNISNNEISKFQTLYLPIDHENFVINLIN